MHLILFYPFFTGLILVDEPYYNEAGYERHKGTQQGRKGGRTDGRMAPSSKFTLMHLR